MKSSALRPGQRKAVETIVSRFRADEPYTALILPTRYGKSDVMRVAAYQLWQDGFLACALALSPNVLLRDQLGDRKNWNEAAARYSLDVSQLKIKTLERLEVRPNANGEMFLSATMQMVERNVDIFAEFVESVLHGTGQRLLVFIDEAHTGSDDNNWGAAGEQLVAAGARLGLLTATAERSDGRRIPGFAFEIEREEPVEVRVCSRGSEPHLTRVSIYEGTRGVLKLVPHNETTFSQAWVEGVLCKIGRVPFDVDLSRVVGGEDEQGIEQGLRLSEITSRQDARRALSRAVRSPTVINEAATRLVREIRPFRYLADDAAAIVFCGNDEGDEEQSERAINRHAKDIERAIIAIDSSLRVVIATSADGEGAARIKAFAAGVGDVLIVKQMASLGLDIPRLKVGVDLSAIRTVAAYIQRMMRIATPYRGISHCVWICPDDILGRGIFAGLVDRSGGAASDIDLELLRTYEIEKGEDATRVFFGIDGTDIADFEDSEKNRATKDKWAIAERLLSAFPALTAHYSHAELASRADLFGVVPSAGGEPQIETVRDTGVESGVVRVEINDLADQLARMRQAYAGYDKDAYVQMRKDAFISAYRTAGVPRGVDLKGIGDLVMLKKVRAAMQEIRDDLARAYARDQQQRAGHDA